MLGRTNRAADRRAAELRDNERKRDHRLFQRDTLLPLGDQIVKAAIETWNQFVKLHEPEFPLPDNAFHEVDRWHRKIAANAVRLRSSARTTHQIAA